MDELAGSFLLWEHEEELAGFAAVDDGDLAVFVSPTRTGTTEAVDFEEAALAWASHSDAPVRWVEFEDDDAVARWRDRGYRPTDEAYLNLVRPLADVHATAPGDARVRPVADDDVADRASITHAAFEETEPFAAYADAYARFRSSPAYPDGWDLLLRDEAERPAACCIAWPDPTSRAGTFEPVATHPDLHGRGFGKAVLTEGLRRFASAGMTFAIVGVEVGNAPAEALYRSVGFRPDRTLRVYERS
jgi:ribosomal protein S18 acetylase RimI-like enzyme